MIFKSRCQFWELDVLAGLLCILPDRTGNQSGQSKKAGIPTGYKPSLNVKNKTKKQTNPKAKRQSLLLHLIWNKNPAGQRQPSLDWFIPEGGGTRCSSILLDWERRMRLKKSSSGTVDALVVGGGAAHLWSFSLEPWHLTNMSKKTSSPSGCSELASRRPYREGVRVVFAVGTGTCDWTWSVLEVEGVQGGLEVLTRKPGKGVMLTRWSSRRRAWELASSSRKWPGSWYSRSRSETATNRHNYYVCE